MVTRLKTLTVKDKQIEKVCVMARCHAIFLQNTCNSSIVLNYLKSSQHRLNGFNDPSMLGIRRLRAKFTGTSNLSMLWSEEENQYNIVHCILQEHKVKELLNCFIECPTCKLAYK